MAVGVLHRPVPLPMLAAPKSVTVLTVPLPFTLLRAPMPPAPAPLMVIGLPVKLRPPSSWSVPPEAATTPVVVAPRAAMRS